MKIVVFEEETREREVFERLRSSHELVFVAEPLRAANALTYVDAEVVFTFVYLVLNREALERLPALKLIATRSTGYDHIDIGECTARGIAVCNVPTYGENTVAEHVFALLLSISHRLPEATVRARSGHFSPEGLEGFDLAGKTIGVVGAGNIGRHVIRIAKGFEMEVVATDARPDTGLTQALGFRYVSFDDLLAISDVVTLHLPATPQTNNMLSVEAIARMKPGAIIINTARGGLIDSHALILALRSGKLAGAGLDVLPDEPLIREEAELISSIFSEQHDLRNLVADHILLHLPSVIVTPHSAFNTREAIHRIAETTVSNIEDFVALRPRNLVTSVTASTADQGR